MVENHMSLAVCPTLMNPFGQLARRSPIGFAPPSDASAKEYCYEINVELPGVKVEDVYVSVQDKSLVVSGHKHSEREETLRSYFFSERQFGAFQRTSRLPPDFDDDNINASFDDGVLYLSVGTQKAI